MSSTVLIWRHGKGIGFWDPEGNALANFEGSNGVFSVEAWSMNARGLVT